MSEQAESAATLPGGREERFRPTTAGWSSTLVVAIAIPGLAAVLAAYLPTDVFESTSDVFILSIGVIGIWRYGWWLVHYVRGMLYRTWTFPRMRRAADEVDAQGYRPGRVFVLCTSYRIDPKVTYAVYEGLARNAIEYGADTIVFAAVSDRTDVDVLQAVLEDCGTPDNLEFRYMFQRGDGKRSAMAEALRAIARCRPDPDDLVVFMDGDIRLPATTFRRTMPFFFLDDELGALTTDNRAVVDGGDFTREWYDLRYAQRHMLMSSTSLSRRVLVLTGRYSVIRADLCTRPDFVEMVERDQLAHRRFGTITFLSGDDKSTWYWLLKNGWAMRYVPDVQVYGFEELPERDRFVASTLNLMRRWYGNMFRTSGRAIALGPRPMGTFVWWCLVDQRLSVWTTLIGPTVAIALTLFVRPSFGIAYLLWILSTRVLASLLLGIPRGRFSPLWPILLYYNQIAGAALKSYVSFRFNQQKWTRQGISSGEAADPRKALWVRRQSAALHAASLAALVAVVSFASGALEVPDRHTWWTIIAGGESRSDDYWLRSSIRYLPDGGHVPLGRSEVLASWRTLDHEKIAGIDGAGVSETALLLADVPEALRISRAGEVLSGTGVIRCGGGSDACVVNDKMRLRNLTLTLR